MSSEDILSKTRILIGYLKDAGLFGGEPGQWKAVAKPNPGRVEFVDHAPVEDFTGSVFRLYDEDGGQSDYFEPPAELGLEHDDSKGKNKGFWKKFVPKEIKAVRTLVETGISAPKSSSELRSWDSRKISKYLLGEAENYEALYACIIAQLENVPTAEAQTAIEQLTALMETTTEPLSKTGKTGKVLKVEEGIEEISRGMEGLGVSGKKPSPPKPKAKVPSPPKPKTPPKAVSPPKKDLAKLEKLIATYQSKLAAKQPTAAIADAISRLAKELGVSDDELGDKYDFYGFGRSRLKPYRRKSRRRSTKKAKMMTRRTSKAKRKVRTSGKSLKKSGKRTSRRKSGRKLSKLKKSFGSSIYGLQGGMQSGPVYSGVYPMTLKVSESLPNLNNVTRSYALNEFGKDVNKKRRGSLKRAGSGKLRRQQSQKHKTLDRRGRRGSSKKTMEATVVEDDSGSEGNSFGCGLYGCGSCGRSFGCGCGGSGNDDET